MNSRQSLEISTMAQFISTLPEGKSVILLEDLSSLLVKELKNVLLSYHEKSSGSRLILFFASMLYSVK